MEDYRSRPIRYLKGVGEKAQQLYGKLGIHTVGELLTYYPYDYEDRSRRRRICDLTAGESACITARVLSQPALRRVRGNLSVAGFIVSDDSGNLAVSVFNQPYLVKSIRRGETYFLFGKAEYYNGRLTLVNPVMERADKADAGLTGRIIPRYRLCAGLSQKGLMKSVRAALELAEGQVAETLPPSLLQRYGFCSAAEALAQIHFPADGQALLRARKRLAFEELFFMQIGLLLLRGKRRCQIGRAFTDTACADDFVSSLPYPLTGAQKKVLSEMLADLAGQRPMNRLVQGDVGSGKTVVAAAAMFVAAKNGFQSALMVPTEILAIQHAQSLQLLFSPFGIRTVLLSGSMTAKEKREAYAKIEQGEADVVIGTQALIQERVAFSRLGLIVADEQHRFGVAQRAVLEQKGENPHVMIMTATPIPRTLSLILYGDLDISVIDELPPGRVPVETFVIGEDKRERMYGFLKKNIAEGRQVYIVCPLVEESEDEAFGDRKSATEYYDMLVQGPFRGYRVALLYGRMPPKEKDAVMRAFAAGETDILVSTTVIEVGVNVPNASVMVIEDAGNFGLAQLHQLRGRVGRGSYRSYCILVSSSRSDTAVQRLSILSRSSDGFYIAEQDLKLRGPGEYFGTRQHGEYQFKIVSISSDMALLQRAQEAAQAVLDQDPALQKPEHRMMRQRAAEIFGGAGGRIALN